MHPRTQYAALPFIQLLDSIEVCLITSRETGRWLVPKGWPKSGMAPHELAALEAFEEAGLKGRTDATPVGHFRYVKRLDDGSDIDCDVSVFAMLVDYQAIDWPEQAQRTVIWVELNEAAAMVDDEELATLLRRFSPQPPPN